MVKDSHSFKDPYLDETSGCLRNRFNIIDENKLSKLETILSSLRIVELVHTPLQKKFDLAHLQATHRYIFQDVYPWAGEIRTVSLQKGSTYFVPPSLIEQGGHYVFNKLAREKHLQGLTPEEFSQRAGYYLGEINHLHPFREGSGRTQRSFMNQLAVRNGYFITWEKGTQEAMIEASIQADRGNSKMMAQIIKENLIDRDYTLALEQYGSSAKGQIKCAESGQVYYGPVIGLTKRYVVQELTEGSPHLILHHRYKLAHDVEALPHKNISIEYPYDKVGLIYEDEKEIQQGLEKNYDKKKELRQKDKPDYER